MSPKEMRTLRETIQAEKYPGGQFMKVKYQHFRCNCGRKYLSEVDRKGRPKIEPCIPCQNGVFSREMNNDEMARQIAHSYSGEFINGKITDELFYAIRAALDAKDAERIKFAKKTWRACEKHMAAYFTDNPPFEPGIDEWLQQEAGQPQPPEDGE